MMNADETAHVIDFTLLRDITGGDRALEKSLFEMFFEASDEALHGLRANTANGQEEAWRKHAHAWKGSCANLGAEKLSQLCRQAQLECMIPSAEKHALLHSIVQEYVAVKAFLEHEMAEIR